MEKLNIMRVLCLLLVVSLFACNSTGKSEKKAEAASVPAKQLVIPKFNTDSCFNYLVKQTDFGARVPNSNAHKECKDYLIKAFQRFGAEVIVQNTQLRAFDGTMLDSYNIIAQYNKDSKDRVFLCAHWDSRPFCDEDANESNHKEPVMGANDGASGVAVILELARLIQIQQPNVGIDFILFDSEDYGHGGTDDSYCLGSQYWAQNLHVPNYRPRFGILLDMVGGVGATFTKDIISMTYAPDVVNMVWQKAAAMGYSSLFLDEIGGSLIDDHYYVNKIANIPCIDIIDFNNGRGFNPTWHTVNDTKDNIDRNVLDAVGKVLVSVIYEL